MTLKACGVAFVLRQLWPAFYGSRELALEAANDWAQPEELRQAKTDDDFITLAQKVHERAAAGRPTT